MGLGSIWGLSGNPLRSPNCKCNSLRTPNLNVENKNKTNRQEGNQLNEPFPLPFSPNSSFNRILLRDN